MTEEKKTLKFQMMMSPAEAEELDDWMFRHRIRSRAEAIRRLTQIGASLDQYVSSLERLATDSPLQEALNEVTISFDDFKQLDAPAETLEKFRAMLSPYMEFHEAVLWAISAMIIETRPLKAGRTMTEAKELQAKFRARLDAIDVSDDQRASQALVELLESLPADSAKDESKH